MPARIQERGFQEALLAIKAIFVMRRERKDEKSREERDGKRRRAIGIEKERRKEEGREGRESNRKLEKERGEKQMRERKIKRVKTPNRVVVNLRGGVN